MGFDGNFDDNLDGPTREAPCRFILDMFTIALRRLLSHVLLVSFVNLQSLNARVCVCVCVWMFMLAHVQGELEASVDFCIGLHVVD